MLEYLNIFIKAWKKLCDWENR